MIEAPAGSPLSEKLIPSLSGSVAVAVKPMAVSSSPDWGPIGSRTGGLFPGTVVSAAENSEVMSKLLQAPVRHRVVVAEMMSPTEPGKLAEKLRIPPPGWVTFAEPART